MANPSKLEAMIVLQDLVVASSAFEGTVTLAADPELLQVAEQALIEHRQKEARSRAREQHIKTLAENLRAFRQEPSRKTFSHLINSCQLSTEVEEVFDFILETLRPAGLPREGPFGLVFNR
jgi:uncharacterized protein VirK/YbjX